MSSTLTTERRQSRRRKPPQLVYLEFGRENGGMIKDVSEGGMRFHLINPVAAGLSVHFAAAIDAVRRMEGQARMVWTDASGKSGGLCFTELSASSRDILQAWLAEIDGPEGCLLYTSQILRALAAKPTVLVPRAVVLLDLAALLRKSNPQEAVGLYQQVKKDYPEASVSDEADRGLESIPPKS